MKTSLPLAGLIAVASCLLNAPQLTFAQCYDGPAGFTPIFNGEDLTGWVAEGATEYEEDGQTKPVWTVEDGLLVCQGKGFGFLRYDKPLSDFVLRLQYRMSPGCNSGVGIRAQAFDPDNPDTRPSVSGYEIQILDDSDKPPTKHSSGSLYRYLAPAVNATRPAGAWNHLEVICLRDYICVILNGEVLHNFNQQAIEQLRDKPLSGFISVQNHGGRIEFRSIRLRELEPVEPRVVPRRPRCRLFRWR